METRTNTPATTGTSTAREAARLRRSGRRGAAALTGTALAAVALVVAADLALVASGRGDLVAPLAPVDPVAAGRAVRDVVATPAVAVGAGAGLAVLGLLLLAAALLPGGRRRVVLRPDDVTLPVVADRPVLADAVAEAAARAAGTGRDQVDVRVRRRRADVAVRPVNGADVPVDDVRTALGPALAGWGVRSRRGAPVAVRVRAAAEGTVAP